MTPTERLSNRDATYIKPPSKRCETCVHCFIGHLCCLGEPPLEMSVEVSPAGVCDQWKRQPKERKDSPR